MTRSRRALSTPLVAQAAASLTLKSPLDAGAATPTGFWVVATPSRSVAGLQAITVNGSIQVRVRQADREAVDVRPTTTR